MDEVGEAEAADLLDHQAEQDEVAVAVLEHLARREGVRVPETVREQLLRGERAARVALQCLGEFRVVAVREQAAAHLGELTQRDPVTVRHAVDVGGDRVVQPDPAVVDQLEQRGDGEGLGLAADPREEVGGHRSAGGGVGDPGRPDVVSPARHPQPDDDARNACLRGHVLDRLVQPRGQLGAEAVRRAAVLPVPGRSPGGGRRSGGRRHGGRHRRREERRGEHAAGGVTLHGAHFFQVRGWDGNVTTRGLAEGSHPRRATRSPLVRSHAGVTPGPAFGVARPAPPHPAQLYPGAVGVGGVGRPAATGSPTRPGRSTPGGPLRDPRGTPARAGLSRCGRCPPHRRRPAGWRCGRPPARSRRASCRRPPG